MRKIITVLFISTILCSCTNGGTKQYTNVNTNKLLKSWEDSQAATRIINKSEGYGIFDTQDIANIIKLRKSALDSVKSVPNDYLDRVHSELKEHFRKEYQKSLKLFLEAYEEGDTVESIESSILGDKWADWYNINRKSVREGFINLEE